MVQYLYILTYEPALGGRVGHVLKRAETSGTPMPPLSFSPPLEGEGQLLMGGGGHRPPPPEPIKAICAYAEARQRKRMPAAVNQTAGNASV